MPASNQPGTFHSAASGWWTHTLGCELMARILDILFTPIRWIWGTMFRSQEGMGPSSSWDASSPYSFIVLAGFCLVALVSAYAICAFAIHWALTSIEWHWNNLLRKRAERGTVDDMLDLAVQVRRSTSRLYSLASRTGVRYAYSDSSDRTELPGADKLPQRRTSRYLTTTVIIVGRLAVFLFDMLRAAVSSFFGLYVLVGTAWTLRPHWFTASVDTFRNWTRMWDPATAPTAIGLIATVLGLITAYAFSTKRRARHKSMFDAAVAAENTLATMGPRAAMAANQVARIAHTVARHDRIFYDDLVADLRDRRLMYDGQIKSVNHVNANTSFQSSQFRRSQGFRPVVNRHMWAELCEQRETTLAELSSLQKASSQVESLLPFVRQAGGHSRALLLDCHPQSPRTNPWRAVSRYDEERYRKQREDLDSLVSTLAYTKSGTTEDDSSTVDVPQTNLEQSTIENKIEELQRKSRRCLWDLAELYAKLVLCDEEVNRSRNPRGINAILSRFIKP